jgi:hypothetical protein
MSKEDIMNKLIVLLVALLLSSSVFAHDDFVRRGGGYGDGGRGYTDRYDHHRGQSIGRELVEVGIGGAIAVAALQIGSAIGGRVAQEISGTQPVQQQRAQVVFVPVCDRTPFVRGGLIYADQCDGMGPVVIGSIDRR